MSARTRLARAELIQLEALRLVSEARRSNDPERIGAIADEIEVLLESLREIRREQLHEDILRQPSASPEQRRSWWRRRPAPPEVSP